MTMVHIDISHHAGLETLWTIGEGTGTCELEFGIFSDPPRPNNTDMKFDTKTKRVLECLRYSCQIYPNCWGRYMETPGLLNCVNPWSLTWFKSPGHPANNGIVF